MSSGWFSASSPGVEACILSLSPVAVVLTCALGVTGLATLPSVTLSFCSSRRQCEQSFVPLPQWGLPSSPLQEGHSQLPALFQTVLMNPGRSWRKPEGTCGLLLGCGSQESRTLMLVSMWPLAIC